MVTLSITNKIFLFDVGKQMMMLELDCNQYASHVNSENFACCFTSKNQLLYVKAQPAVKSESDESVSLLLCHPLRTIPQLEDFFAYNSSAQFYESYLPFRSSLTDRIKILMEKRIDEQCFRKERLKKMWGEIQQHRNI
jgi:hypothetical protein